MRAHRASVCMHAGQLGLDSRNPSLECENANSSSTRILDPRLASFPMQSPIANANSRQAHVLGLAIDYAIVITDSMAKTEAMQCSDSWLASICMQRVLLDMANFEASNVELNLLRRHANSVSSRHQDNLRVSRFHACRWIFYLKHTQLLLLLCLMSRLVAQDLYTFAYSICNQLASEVERLIELGEHQSLRLAVLSCDTSMGALRQEQIETGSAPVCVSSNANSRVL